MCFFSDSAPVGCFNSWGYLSVFEEEISVFGFTVGGSFLEELILDTVLPYLIIYFSTHLIFYLASFLKLTIGFRTAVSLVKRIQNLELELKG